MISDYIACQTDCDVLYAGRRPWINCMVDEWSEASLSSSSKFSQSYVAELIASLRINR